MQEKEALILKDKDGKPWVACPYCKKRAFPITEKTKIKNLMYKCKDNKCKQLFLVNVGNEHN